MTDPTSFKALAAEWEREADEPATQEISNALLIRTMVAELRALIAARPASDLEKRLRDEAPKTPDLLARAALLEAANAQAAMSEMIDAQNSVGVRRETHILKLERELDLSQRESAGNEEAMHLWRTRATATESRLAAVALEVTKWRAETEAPDSYAAMRRVEAAIAAPAQTEKYQ